jgi:acyl-CoA synthetase (AMP-forming)/AMP-acid ligase II
MIDNTLPEVLAAYAQGQGDGRCHGFWVANDRKFELISYSDLSRQAFSLAAYLRTSLGCNRGDGILIAAATPKITLLSFFAAIINAALPIIVPAGVVKGRDRAVLEAKSLLSGTRKIFVLSDRKGSNELHQIRIDKALIDEVYNPNVALDYMSKDGVAYVQLSSATTGAPKGVAISHQNLAANVYGIRHSSGCRINECGVSWLPLYHDMGLVGAEMFCFMNGYSLHSMSPFDYIKDPSLWMRTISDMKATLSVSPNFGYAYAADNVPDESLEGLNLRSWWRAFNGAEPISPAVMKRFVRKFGAAGFQEQAFVPCYGLAESTLAVTVKKDISTGHIRGFLKSSLIRGRHVIATPLFKEDVDSKGSEYLFSVSCGTPLDGMQVSICDESGTIMTDGMLGEVFVCGPSVATEVDAINMRDEGASIPTGDIGVLLENELYVLDRIKNIVIRNGRNYAITPIEEEVAELHGIPADRVAIFELSKPQSDSERPVVALIELVEGCLMDIDTSKIKALEFPLSLLAYARPNSIPKTTSGKKRHFLCRDLFEKGSIQVEHAHTI